MAFFDIMSIYQVKELYMSLQTKILKTNIARLKTTIQQNCWNQGYVSNLKATLASYKKELAELTD
jgi:ribosomal protein L29